LDVGTLLKVLEKLSALLLEQPAVTATKSKVIKGILILCIISSPSKKNHLRAFILALASIVSTKLRASFPWLVDLILYVRTRSVLCQPYASEACGRSLDRANAELNFSKPHATAAQRH